MQRAQECQLLSVCWGVQGEGTWPPAPWPAVGLEAGWDPHCPFLHVLSSPSAAPKHSLCSPHPYMAPAGAPSWAPQGRDMPSKGGGGRVTPVDIGQGVAYYSKGLGHSSLGFPSAGSALASINRSQALTGLWSLAGLVGTQASLGNSSQALEAGPV